MVVIAFLEVFSNSSMYAKLFKYSSFVTSNSTPSPFGKSVASVPHPFLLRIDALYS
jgi:hypothetical protein